MLFRITLTLKSIYQYSFVKNTPLEFNNRLSQLYNCQVYLKREDQQVTRSFKIRGALNKIHQTYQINPSKIMRGVVTCSAGNHAQGVAYSCKHLGIKSIVYIPDTTPLQKQRRIEHLGAELRIIGQTFDESLMHALKFSKENDLVFVHPFDDPDVIAGQGTISQEILPILSPDIIICPIGGGGLISGQIAYRNKFSKIKYSIIGAQPINAPSMLTSINNGQLTKLESIDTFVDGASVKQAGILTFNQCMNNIDRIELIDNDQLCHTIEQLYNDDGIIAEPAGALSVAALSQLQDVIVGRKVVCIISGGNNDIRRNSEFVERSLIHQGLVHYFVIRFPQRPGALEDFINKVLSGSSVDIVRFEYLRKNNRSYGSVLLGLELKKSSDINQLINKLNQTYKYKRINPEDEPTYDYII